MFATEAALLAASVMDNKQKKGVVKITHQVLSGCCRTKMLTFWLDKKTSATFFMSDISLLAGSVGNQPEKGSVSVPPGVLVLGCFSKAHFEAPCEAKPTKPLPPFFLKDPGGTPKSGFVGVL